MAICRVYRDRSERENIQWVAVRHRENTLLMSGVSKEWPDWFDLLASQITTRYNRCLPESLSECTTHRNLKQMSDVNRRPHHVPLLITGNRAAVVTASPEIGQQKMGKMLSTSYLIGLDFCCDIQMTWSEFGIKNMKAWLHPSYYQQFKLMVVWWCGEISSWHPLGPSVLTEHCLNTTTESMSNLSQ